MGTVSRKLSTLEKITFGGMFGATNLLDLVPGFGAAVGLVAKGVVCVGYHGYNEFQSSKSLRISQLYDIEEMAPTAQTVAYEVLLRFHQVIPLLKKKGVVVFARCCAELMVQHALENDLVKILKKANLKSQPLSSVNRKEPENTSISNDQRLRLHAQKRVLNNFPKHNITPFSSPGTDDHLTDVQLVAKAIRCMFVDLSNGNINLGSIGTKSLAVRSKTVGLFPSQVISDGKVSVKALLQTTSIRSDDGSIWYYISPNPKDSTTRITTGVWFRFVQQSHMHLEFSRCDMCQFYQRSKKHTNDYTLPIALKWKTPITNIAPQEINDFLQGSPNRREIHNREVPSGTSSKKKDKKEARKEKRQKIASWIGFALEEGMDVLL